MRAALAALALWAPAAAAQSPRMLLRDARQAFLVIELDRARDLAIQGLAEHGADSLDTPEQADALMLLGAVAVLDERPDDAERRFRELILLIPDYRPDSLLIPSGPMQAFLAARQAVKATSVDLATHQRVAPGTPLLAGIRVSSFHDVSVTIVSAAGDTVHVLWSGPIREREVLSWDGSGAGTGRYTLVSASRDGPRVLREVHVPLTITAQLLDTLPWPPRPRLLPERAAGAGDRRLLAAGAGLGAGVLLAPVVARGAGGTPARFLVAGALTLGGVLAFFRGRDAVTLERNVIANRTARAAWERERAQVRRVNAERRAGAVLDVRAGVHRRVER